MSQPPVIKPVNLKNIFLKYIYYWPLFILGLAVTLAIAVAYLKITKPTYEIRASILVQDVKKTSQEKSALQELDQSNESKIAENEVEVLSSHNLVSQVVGQLQLWVDYAMKDGLLEQDLYKITPVNFVFLSPESGYKPFTIKATINDGNSFSVEKKNGQITKYSFNQTINSDFGQWKLIPTARLSKYLGKNIIIRVNDTVAAVDKYQSKLQVSLVNKLAPTVGLSINDKEVNRGKDFLNTLIFNYNRAATLEKNRLTASTIDFIDKRLDSLAGDLNHAEGAVEKYRSDKGLTDISSESKVYLENEQANGSKLNDVNIQISVIDGIERSINAPQNLNSTPSTIGISDPNLTGLVERLSQLQLQKAKLLTTTPEGSPDFESLNSQIRVTRNAIANTVKSIKASLLTTKRQLESYGAKVQSSIKEVPRQERQLLNVKRQQTIKEDLYVYLLQKREELSLSYTSTLADARVIDNAYIGPVIWPQKTPLLAIATFLGLLIPFFIIYARDNIKDKVLTKDDIEKTLSVPILGELPADDSSTNGLVDQSVNNVTSEHLRSIRTKLNSSVTDVPGKGKMALITSSVSGEGKTFLSSNLSTSLAFLGRKTVLLELDLRKPKISTLFDINNTIGLTDYLGSDHISVNEIIQASGSFHKLDIIPAGKAVNNPTELLDNERLETLLAYLRTIYDNIIIDSPPLHLVTDSLIISRLTDITLYVIRQGVTNKDELLFIKELVEQDELKNIKIIFNGIAEGKFGYGRNYSDRYYEAKPSFSFKRWGKKFASRF